MVRKTEMRVSSIVHNFKIIIKSLPFQMLALFGGETCSYGIVRIQISEIPVKLVLKIVLLFRTTRTRKGQLTFPHRLHGNVLPLEWLIICLFRVPFAVNF